ncbi:MULTISPECIES: homocysteine S-methyltransferase [unclassified Gilliamella]|uniref:homocysteine S-methyltransferase n=1 Tax=unclassified Gilliamella TaxID=2685620 RepID=UPI0018DE40EA|nr:MULTISPECIES: homocysteine S-methyltransferase [unclassified Gilliamella]MBI0029549.1 homocysteine S-methyltransferase [Gilliamella sp. B14448G7]MBI0031950.1 homocysteine S-methyltransferase [Gilliamella sp. B14384G15]MBI0036539.1 homocysteine S-methyltransferase [Gilliamella sp. B14448G11]MBI0043701.1 homocysteine S-methyltransferase [Gilliamella sp. B14448G12]MBI0059495.1 homocysteine S-methyltransferase [Gilliamella sp. B14384G12]
MKDNNPIKPLLEQKKHMIIDGALASELQRRGCDLNDSLWSAKVLIEQPELIQQVHYDYFKAGADCAITASYQATPMGFAQKGIELEESIKLIKTSVKLAQQAKMQYLNDIKEDKALLIAGSVGPYGAYLANGSEYTGDYQLSESEFIAFHKDRVTALIDAGVDILACETMPSFLEIKALTKLIQQFPMVNCWFSLTLKDQQHISDGTPLTEVIEYLNSIEQIVSVGINCIALEKVTPALEVLSKLTSKPLIVYPNSGEEYDPTTKQWHKNHHHNCTFANQLDTWIKLGAKLIGGCCQTTPEDIVEIHQLLNKK